MKRLVSLSAPPSFALFDSIRICLEFNLTDNQQFSVLPKKEIMSLAG